MRKRALMLGLTAVVATSSFLAPSMASTTAPSTSMSIVGTDADRCMEWNVHDWVTRLRGDLDGDRVVDTVATRARWVGENTCRAVLVVRTARGTTHVAIPGYLGLLMKPPALAGLVKVGPGRHLGIAVVVLLGANTVWLDLYALSGGRLHQVNHGIPRRYGGGIAYCSGPTSCATTRRGRGDAGRVRPTHQPDLVRRSFYALASGQLVRVPAAHRAVRHRAAQARPLPRAERGSVVLELHGGRWLVMTEHADRPANGLLGSRAAREIAGAGRATCQLPGQ